MIRSLLNAFFLADRYLRYAPVRSAVLVLGTTVALSLPVFTWLAAELVEVHIFDRARSSPVLLGHKGNEFDLTMAHRYTPNLGVTVGASFVFQVDGLTEIGRLNDNMTWLYVMFDAIF